MLHREIQINGYRYEQYCYFTLNIISCVKNTCDEEITDTI